MVTSQNNIYFYKYVLQCTVQIWPCPDPSCAAVKFPVSYLLWRSSTEHWTNSSPQELGTFPNKWVPLFIIYTMVNPQTKIHIVMCFFLDLQMSPDSGQSVPVMLEQLTKLLYSIEDKVKYQLPVLTTTCLGSMMLVEDDKSTSVFYFRQKVLCVSPLDTTVVTGNLSYRSLCSRYFCKLTTI